MSDPVATIAIQAKSTGLAAQLAEARAKFGRFADGVSNILTKPIGKKKKGEGFGQMLQVAGGNLLSGAASKATGYIEDVAKSTLDFDDKLARLQITADATPESMGAFADSVRDASNATGKSKNEILEAASSYVALTGDMDTARASTMTWAKVAQATNSTVADIASTAAAMSQNMAIGPKDMEATFSALANQGKKGAIELKDLAGLMSQIAPQWAMFSKGKGVEGVRDLGAALQVVKRGFGGDASETVTGLQALLTSLVKNAERFKEGGVKGIFKTGKGGKKELADVFTIVDAIAKSKLMKDPTALEKAFGRVEAYRAFVQLSQNRKVLDDLVEAGKDNNVIQRDFGTYMNTTAGKTAAAFEKLKNTVAEAFTPERIEKFAGLLGKIVSFAADAAGYFDHLLGSDAGVQGTTENYLVEHANTGDEGDRDEMIALARKAVHGDLMAQTQLGIKATGNYALGDAQRNAVLEGARKYLKSEGLDQVDASAVDQVTQTTRTAAAKAGGGADVAAAIRDGFKGLAQSDFFKPLLQIDGKEVATAAKKSNVHHQGVKR